MKNFDELIRSALENLNKAESFDIEYSAALANIAVGQALIAIAQELRKINVRAEEEFERQERKAEYESRRAQLDW